MKNNNYLEVIPIKNPEINWEIKDGNITLMLENKGAFNRIAQKLFKKPKISYIHLDEMGSFIWPLIDGETNIIKLGEKVEAHFGDKAQPLYERLSQYIKTLENCGFIKF